MVTISDINPQRMQAALDDVPHMESVSCDCPKCRRMCDIPCIGTPEDMAKIAAAGLSAGLAPTTYAPFLLLGIPPVEIVAPIATRKGCVFRSGDGHCLLHARGLKPTEGKLASCKRSPEESIAIPLHILREWKP